MNYYPKETIKFTKIKYLKLLLFIPDLYNNLIIKCELIY